MDYKITEKTIEFDKVKDQWMSFALTDTAKMKIKNIEPYLSESEVKTRLRETTESRQIIEKCGNPPLAAFDGIRDLLTMAEKGQCLSATELLQIGITLAAVNRMKAYLEKGKSYNIPLAFYEENLEPLEDIRETISVTIVNETVSDNASKLLKSLRYDIALAEEKMRQKADIAIKKYKEYVSDSFSTIRGGHICIPVKTEYKLKVSGSVIDKSASGSTLFVEPTASAKYYEELQILRLDEENEVQRILYEITAMIASCAGILQNNIEVMEKLDFIFSKGKLSVELDGCQPEIISERKISLVDARHPLMDKKICVPLKFSIGDGNRGVVITGPNTGGKTVALKTVTLNLMMGQCGLHVSCREAQICMHSNFLCDIGDGQNISENLSTFSAHIKNVMNILKALNRESFVIMDELGSGTDPQEGMGIAIAILEELKNSGAFFLVTTHYPEVKVYAKETDCIVNARMTFDKEQLKPLYQLVIGEAGESCAFYIASRLGMPAKMLKRAAIEVYGDNFDITSINAVTENDFKKEHSPHIIKEKTHTAKKRITFKRGDSVMIYPDKKIGIVCQEANENGALQVQLAGKKIWINHKRVKLHVAASELYPEDYDFSIIFDSVETRKLRHDMGRKYVADKSIIIE